MKDLVTVCGKSNFKPDVTRKNIKITMKLLTFNTESLKVSRVHLQQNCAPSGDPSPLRERVFMERGARGGVARGSRIAPERRGKCACGVGWSQPARLPSTAMAGLSVDLSVVSAVLSHSPDGAGSD